jgi:hypothetical protein
MSIVSTNCSSLHNQNSSSMALLADLVPLP